jgi:hypothetical protein
MMASASSIGRLHRAGEQKPQFAQLPQPESAPVKSETVSNSQIAAPAPAERRRGRFVLGRAEPAGYQLDSAAIMSIMQPAAPLDRSFQFAAMAEREQVQSVAQRYLAARGKIGGR